MSEYVGLITGSYDTKKASFRPGGYFLSSMMTPHGLGAKGFEAASTVELGPKRVAQDTLSSVNMVVTDWALTSETRDLNVHADWQGFKKHFKLP